MIRALILPYVQRPGLAGCEITIRRDVADDVAVVEQHEIGRVVDLDEPRPVQRRHRREQWQTKERVITEEDIHAAVAWAQGILLRYGVTESEIQTATGEGATAQRSQRIGAAMRLGLYTHGTIDEGTADSQAVLTSLREKHGAEIASLICGSRDRGSVNGLPVIAIEAMPPVETIADLRGAFTAQIVVDLSQKQGTRILGVDPGSHWVACTVAEQRGEELVYITSRVFEIGRVVPIKPRTIKRKDGSTYTIATKREIMDADIGALLRAVMAWLELLQVDRAVLERATHFRTDAPVDGAGGARATGLARAQWIGGELAGTLRAALYDAKGGGDKVQTVASASWRATARRGIHEAASTDSSVPYLWREGVRAAFGASWPVGAGEHELDAAGCIVWAVRGPAARLEQPRVPRVKIERPKRSSAESHEKRDARTKRRRKRLRKKGCLCHGRHRRECPMFVPMTYRKGAES